MVLTGRPCFVVLRQSIYIFESKCIFTINTFTLLKYTEDLDKNQFQKIANTEEIYSILKDLMGTSGIVSFDKKIVFIEGNSTSPDIDIFEKLFSEEKIKFISAGDCNIISQTSKKVEKLLSTSCEYNDYYGIVDGDMNIFGNVLTPSDNLFILPVYHIENYLLDEDLILAVTKKLDRLKCKYKSKEQIESDLKEILLEKNHLNAFVKAYVDYNKVIIFRNIKNEIDNNQEITARSIIIDKHFNEGKDILEKSISDGEWKKKCVGRVLLKSFCGKNNYNYINFRNLLISEINEPHEDLKEIINKIIN